MKKFVRILLYGILALFLYALLVPEQGFAPMKVIGVLLFGWFSFLRRVVPEVATNWSGIAMVVLCSAAIIAGTHWFGRWIYAHNNSGPERRWRWRWSFSLYAAFCLLFVAAMGITGVFHQLGWLLSSEEPLVVPRKHSAMPKFLMRLAASQLVQAAEGANWELPASRQNFFTSQHSERNRQSLDDLHVLFIPGKEEKLAAAIIFPRDRAAQERTGFTLILNGANSQEEQHPMKDLPEVLARFGSK